MDRVQLLKRETAALGGDAADTLPYPAPIEPQEDAIEAAGLYLQDVSNRDETVLIDRNGNDMRFTDPNNSGGVTLSALVRSVSKVGTPVNNQLAVWTGDGTLEGESELTYDGSTLTVTGDVSATNISGSKVAVAGPIRMTEVASPDADEAGKGQIWVKDNVPNDLFFRDDTGVDHLISWTESEYALLAGRAGGQTLYGGAEASQSLTLGSTISATKGSILFGAAGAFDEATESFGIGTTAIPHGGIGWAQLAIEGSTPYVQFTTATDDYPILQITPAAHDSVGLYFDCYYDGVKRSGFADSNAIFGKEFDFIGVQVDSGTAAGSAMSTTNAWGTECSTGYTMFGNINPVSISPDSLVHVYDGSAGTVAAAANTVVTIENSTTAYLSFLTPNTATAGILFGDPEDNDVGSVTYSHSANQLSFTDGTTGTKTLAELAAGSGGDVSASGTPVNDQIAIWTNATTIEGQTALTFSGTELLVAATAPIGYLKDAAGGAAALSRTMAGLQLSAVAMDTSGKYTPAVKFMSTDVAFVTENPKFLAGIVGRATQTYADDADGGMALDFAVTADDPGTTNVPAVGMSLTSTGLGIGTDAPAASVHIYTSAVNTANSTADDLVIEANDNTGMTIMSGASQRGSIEFGDSGTATIGGIEYEHSDNTLNLKAASGTRLRILGSSGVGIGQFDPEGFLHVKRSDVGVTPISTADEFIIEASGTPTIGMQILGSADHTGSIYFGDDASATQGAIRYDHSTDTMLLHAGGSPRVELNDYELWIKDPNVGASALTRTMSGLQLSAQNMSSTADKYTPAVKFMSTDANFSTENPKLGALIVGRATEPYVADTDGGMALDFAVTADDPGTTNVPTVGMSLTSTGLGVGETVPLGTAHIKSADVGTISPNAVADDLIVENSSDAGLTIYSGSTATANLYFANESADLGAAIFYTHSSNLLSFYVQSDTRASLTGARFQLHNIPLYFTDSATEIRVSATNLQFKDAVAGTKTLSDLVNDVQISGTPANNQVAVWTNNDTLEGESELTYDGTILTVSGNVTADKVGVAATPASVGGIPSALYVYRPASTWGMALEDDGTGGQADMLFSKTNNAVDEKYVQHVLAGSNYQIRSLTDAVGVNHTFQSYDLTTGYVGIGIAAADAPLHVHDGSAGTVAAPSGTVVTVENSAAAYLSFLTPNTASSGLRFGDPEDNDVGQITYSHSANQLSFTDGTTGTKTLAELAAGGDVSASGTPVNNQLAVWTDASTIEGDTRLTFDGTELRVGHSTGPAQIRLVPTSGNAALSSRIYMLENDEGFGGYLQFDGSANIFHIGTRNSSVDTPAISIVRSNQYVGIGTAAAATTLLDIEGDSATVTINATTGTGEIQFQEAGADRWAIRQNPTNKLLFDWGGTSMVTFDGTGSTGWVGMGTGSDTVEANLQVKDAVDPIIWLEDTGAMLTAPALTMPGLQLSSGAYSGNQSITPAIKFMSTDSALTENPKFLAGIWGFSPSSSYTDTVSPMGIRFGTTPYSAGASTVPDAAVDIDWDGAFHSYYRTTYQGAVVSEMRHKYESSRARLLVDGTNAQLKLYARGISDATDSRDATIELQGAESTGNEAYASISFKNYDASSGSPSNFTGASIVAMKESTDDCKIKIYTARDKSNSEALEIDSWGHLNMLGGGYYMANNDMVFATPNRNSPRMYIDSSTGWVSIGEATALGRFHVHEPETSTDVAVYVTPETSSRDSRLILGGDASAQEGMYLQWDGSASDFFIGYRTGGSETSLIDWDSSEDKIQINTDLELREPDAVLRINGGQGGDTATLELQADQDVNGEVSGQILFNDDTGVVEYTGGAIRTIREGTSANRLEFQTAANTTNPNTAMVIDPQSRVMVSHQSTDPQVLFHVHDTVQETQIRLETIQSGSDVGEYENDDSPGIELMCATMDTTNRYTPSVKFMSSDTSLGANKYLAGIVGKALQSFTSSSTKGTAIELLCCQEDNSSTPLTVATFHKQASGKDYEALELEGAIKLTASQSSAAADGTIDYNGGFRFRHSSSWLNLGTGDVTKVGTPADNQVGVWTGDGTIEGDVSLTMNNASSPPRLTAIASIRIDDGESESPVDSTQGLELRSTDGAVVSGDYFPPIKWLSTDSNLTTNTIGYITMRAESDITSNFPETQLLLANRNANTGININNGGVWISYGFAAASNRADALLHVGRDVLSHPTIATDTIALFEDDTDNLYIQLMGGTSQVQQIRFGDTGDLDAGYIQYDHGDQWMQLNAESNGKISIGVNGSTKDLGVNSSGPYSRRAIESSTATSGSPNTFDTDESDKVLYTNALSRNYHTLPSAEPGWILTFCVYNSNGIRVTANTGDTIRIEATTTSSGGYIQSTTIGDCITLVALTASEWYAVSYTGFGWTLN